MSCVCVAPGCNNTNEQRNDLTFYYFPKKRSRRQKWISALHRGRWTPAYQSRLCSEHFISGKKSEDPLNPDYVPSLFKFPKPEEAEEKIDDSTDPEEKIIAVTEPEEKIIAVTEPEETINNSTDPEENIIAVTEPEETINNSPEKKQPLKLLGHLTNTISDQEVLVPLETDTEDTEDSSEETEDHEDGSQNVEHHANTVQEDGSVPCIKEEASAEALQTTDAVDRVSSKQDNDTVVQDVKRKLEVEADDIKDGDPSAKISKPNVTTPTIPKKRTRNNETYSLAELAHKFVQMIGFNNTVFDLNDIAKKLGIPKRRLYDVTNVLHGLMYIKKESSNLMRWIGPQFSSSKDDELQLFTEVEMKLDELIEDCILQLHSLCQDSSTHRLAYLTYEDLQVIPTLRDQTVFVIKAPEDTKMEVSHPHDAFLIHLCSSQGPIEVSMCRDDPVLSEGTESSLPSTASENDSAHSVPSPKDSSCGINSSLAEPTPHSSPVTHTPHLPQTSP